MINIYIFFIVKFNVFSMWKSYIKAHASGVCLFFSWGLGDYSAELGGQSSNTYPRNVKLRGCMLWPKAATGGKMGVGEGGNPGSPGSIGVQGQG